MPNNSSALDRNKPFRMPRCLASPSSSAYSRPMDFTEEVARLAEEAKRRDQRAFDEIATQFSAEHQPVVMTHAAFAYLHAAIVQATATLISGQYSATCGGGGGEIIVELGPRRIVYRHCYQRSEIEVTFLDQSTGAITAALWHPPMTTDANELFLAGRGVALDATRYLTGLGHPLF